MKKAIILLNIIFLLIVNLSCNKEISYFVCFEHYSNSYTVNNPIFFNAQCSKEVKGYQWDFGDGIIKEHYNKDTISHSYITPGIYTVVLTKQYEEAGFSFGTAKVSPESITRVEKIIEIK